MALMAKYQLSQFSEVFKLRNKEGKPYLLIGGQAVNFWAEKYLCEEPILERLQPFTSEDIDFKGNRADVEDIARQLNLHPTFPASVAMTALAGSIPFRSGDIDSNIEVVRIIPGTPKNIEETAINVEWEERRLRVIDPISLFAAKLELVATVAQDNRQDAHHLRIMTHCVRRFLEGLLGEVDRGEIPSRHWLNAVGYVRKITTTKRASKISKKLNLDWQSALPWTAIEVSNNPKIRRFYETRKTASPDQRSNKSAKSG